MRVLYDGDENKTHSCKSEIGWDSAGRVEKHDYPRVGMILECSCGKLYTTLNCDSTYYYDIERATWRQKRQVKKKRVAP